MRFAAALILACITLAFAHDGQVLRIHYLPRIPDHPLAAWRQALREQVCAGREDCAARAARLEQRPIPGQRYATKHVCVAEPDSNKADALLLSDQGDCVRFQTWNIPTALFHDVQLYLGKPNLDGSAEKRSGALRMTADVLIYDRSRLQVLAQVIAASRRLGALDLCFRLQNQGEADERARVVECPPKTPPD